MEPKNTTLDDIAAEIGMTAALRLSAWFGDDNKCYVPLKVEEGQLLVRLIGMSAARRLTEAFPGDMLAIPRLTQYENDVRARQIGQLLTRGFPTRQIAGWMRITERRVQQICRELEQAGLIDPIGPVKKRPGKGPKENLLPEDAPENLQQKAPGKRPQEKAPAKSGVKKPAFKSSPSR